MDDSDDGYFPDPDDDVQINFTNGKVYFGRINKDQQMHGLGKLVWPDGKVYIGNFVNDIMSGEGMMTFSNGDIFIGTFKKNIMNHGKYIWNHGSVYIGSFQDSKAIGRGVYTFPNGNVYTGKFIDDMFNGFGVLTDQYGNIIYKGFWRENNPLIRENPPYREPLQRHEGGKSRKNPLLKKRSKKRSKKTIKKRKI